MTKDERAQYDFDKGLCELAQTTPFTLAEYRAEAKRAQLYRTKVYGRQPFSDAELLDILKSAAAVAAALGYGLDAAPIASVVSVDAEPHP